MKIGIVGAGVVGSATAHAFKGHVDEVRVYDINKDRSTHSVGEVLLTDIVFVCLPTPQKVDSLECDLSHVEKFFKYVSNTSAVNYVLRSTVPIGTTRKLREQYDLPNLVHSPEFLTARTAMEDAANPTRMIVGVPGWDKEADEWHNDCAAMLCKLYRKVFKCREAGTVTENWTPELFVMTSDESEAVKLMQNSYSAVVIATLNEFRCLADKTGMDWDRIMQALLVSGWLAPHHTKVPGPDGKRGFGGSCLPKDLANLINCIIERVNDNHALVMDTGDEYMTCISVLQAAYDRNQYIDRIEE